MPSGAESLLAGVCLAPWTTSSCAGTWSCSWRRWPSRTAGAGTLTSTMTRRFPAGFSGRKYPQSALISTVSPLGWRTSSVLQKVMMEAALGPTRKTAPTSPTRVPLTRRPSRGRGRSSNPETRELQVRITSLQIHMESVSSSCHPIIHFYWLYLCNE